MIGGCARIELYCAKERTETKQCNSDYKWKTSRSLATHFSISLSLNHTGSMITQNLRQESKINTLTVEQHSLESHVPILFQYRNERELYLEMTCQHHGVSDE